MQTLWHYTSPDAAHKIIESKEVWLTHIRYLNDSREYVDAIDVALHWLYEHCPEEWRAAGRWLLDWIESSRRGTMDDHVYVASFSGREDDLSQWRAYARTGGFALGFSLDALRRLVSSLDYLELQPCMYEPEAKLDRVAGLFTHHIENAATRLGGLANVGRQASGDRAYHLAVMGVRTEFFRSFNLTAALIKDAAFKAEDEWRLVTKPGFGNRPPTRFRATPSLLVPYISVSLGGDAAALTAVTVGPCSHPELNEDAIRMRCNSLAIHPVAVERSRAPFRAL